MRKILLLLSILLLPFFVRSQTVHPDYEDGKLWVKFRKDIVSSTPSSARMKEMPVSQLISSGSLREKFGVNAAMTPFSAAKKDTPLRQTVMLNFKDINRVDELIRELEQDEQIEYVEKVPLMKIFAEPNDPDYSRQWYLSHIGAASAWDRFSTGSTVVIAIVDDAVDHTHPDLVPNLWVNPGEIPGNGIDDDGNGYIDDINGWDVANNDNNPGPPTSAYDHGTHVAGIASAATGNGLGIAGMGYSCRIMCVKATNSSSIMTNAYEGVLYAADNGADIINCSWGGSVQSATHLNIVRYAQEQGCIVVSAAGNNSSSSVFYPAGYPGVISVASTNNDDKKSSFSNYGSWVTISAPGNIIYSTLPGNTYGSKSGTSMASPLVAGLLGLMKSLHPLMPDNDLVECLKSTATAIDDLNPGFAGQLGMGRINAAAAMQCVQEALLRAPHADFSANTTVLSAGGMVRYTNLSTYASSWVWEFSGGSPSSYTGQDPPLIRYDTPGTYDVRLTVSNPNGNDVLVKTGYITVEEAAGCTTINYPIPEEWTIVNYSAGASNGWVNGVNASQEQEKAMYFDASAYTGVLVSAWIAFGRAYSDDPAKQVPVRIYDGTSGSPGAEIGSAVLTMAQIMNDVNHSWYTSVEFEPVITLPPSKKIFVSVDLTHLQWTATVKDTLSIVSNSQGQSVPSPIWERRSDSQWRRYTTPGSWNLAASLLVHPFLTPAPPIAVISSSATTICAGETITFDAAGSTHEGGILWNFQGGLPATSGAVSQTVLFDTPGTYRINLSVAGGGCLRVRDKYVDIVVKPRPALGVSISKNPLCAGESATLTASGAETYAWFGPDGTQVGTAAVFPVTPPATATYTVTGTGASCETTVPIQVIVNPTTAAVDLIVSANNTEAGTPVTFTAIPENGGAQPAFTFKVNDEVVQTGELATWTSASLQDGDVVSCLMTSNAECVLVSEVTSNTIAMQISGGLPVTLLSFKARKQENTVLLTWKTTEETNFSHFGIQRSADARVWQAIGAVPAKSSGSYIFTDATPPHQFITTSPHHHILYYRLKIVNTDGSFVYSGIEAVSFDRGNEGLDVRIYPNPAHKGKVTIEATGRISRPVNVQIFDLMGREVYTAASGATEIDVSRFAPGIYLLHIRQENESIVRKLVVE